ncbi:hypothetical protein GCM10009720_04250 [Yaniella flava]|uniref:Uncharacterized protein n=1 Tax=Yaniella flava TaxID=287930 RepID=A0ABP5FIU2_9MICC
MARRYSSDVNSAVSQSNRPESASQPDETAYDNRGIQQTVTIFWSPESTVADCTRTRTGNGDVVFGFRGHAGID